MAAKNAQFNDIEDEPGWGYDQDFKEWDHDIFLQWVQQMDDEGLGEHEWSIGSTGEEIEPVEHFTRSKLGNPDWLKQELRLPQAVATRFAQIVQRRMSGYENHVRREAQSPFGFLYVPPKQPPKPAAQHWAKPRVSEKRPNHEFAKKDQNAENREELQLMKAKLDSIVVNLDKMMASMQAFERRVNSIELRLDEEHKHNEHLLNEVKAIKHSISEVSANKQLKTEQQALQRWLANEVGFPQYFDVFVANGVEDLLTVSLLNMQTLKGMGIDSIGHQVKILHYIAKLNQSNNSYVEEGATAQI